MTSLHVICGLPPPPIKNPGYAYDPFQRRKTELLAVPLKVLSRRIQQNAADRSMSTQKNNVSRLSSENVKRSFTSFVLIDNDVF